MPSRILTLDRNIEQVVRSLGSSGSRIEHHGGWLVEVRSSAAIGLALFAAGCGGGSPAMTGSRQVDMCTILSGTELSQLGVVATSRIPVDRAGSVGCEWTGKPFILSLERDSQPLASYRARPRPAFISYMENTVSGRPGARFRVDRDGTECEQLMDGGPVSLVVSVAPTAADNSQPIDSCTEALRIAELIEPRLPKR